MIWNRLSYEILNLKNPDTKETEKHNQAYLFWKSQWDMFLQEHHLDEHLYSDDFTRSDAAGVMYYDSKVVAIILFKERDLNLSSSQDDSYFKVWPKHLIEQLKHDRITKVMSAGYLTVHPLMRGEQFSPSLKHLMVGLVGCHLTQTTAQVGICVTNNLKGVNGSTEKCGWQMIASGLSHFNHPVNLYVLTQESAQDFLTTESTFSESIQTLYFSKNQKQQKTA